MLFPQYEPSFSIRKKEYIPHNEVPNALNGADLLILMIPKAKDNKLIITGKIFEYLAVKTTVLGIGPKDGDAAQIIQQTDAGQFFETDETSSMTSFIRKNLTASTSSFIGVEKFSRRAQAEVLANLLKKR